MQQKLDKEKSDVSLDQAKGWGRQWWQLFALIAITFAAYYPTLGNGFIWDDNRYIEDNFQLHTPKGLERIWLEPLKAEPQYYPLTHTTLWVEYHFWRLRAFGYHLDNLVLHAAGAVMLWRLLRRLKVGGAWAAAMIFAVHPLQVESVAWATERKNVLSGFFFLLSLWAYLRTKWGRRIWQGEASSGSGGLALHVGAGWYFLSLLFFAAALLSKSVTATLPAAILVLCWWKRGKIRAGDVWPVTPMLIAGMAMGFLTGWMEKHVVGAIGPDFDFLTPLDRLCIAGRAFWFYLVKLLWPGHLSFIYPHWQVDPAQRPMWILFPLAAMGLLIGCWLLRGRIGRGPAAAMLFFAGTLVPALGFVNVFPMRYSYVADHFQYLACIGPIALIVGILSTGCTSGATKVLAALVIVTMCAASNVRARVFVDRRTLWTDTLAKNPDSRLVRNNYAATLRDAGELEAAKAQYRQAMRLGNDAGDLVGLGQCFAMQGDFSAAREMYQKAVAATPVSSEPVFRRLLAGRYFQLGTAYQGLGGEYLAKAEESYRRAIDLFPEYEDARKNLAVTLIDQKRYAEAIEQCRAILEQNPESVGAHTNLGTAYYEQGQLDLALQEYQRVLELEPENVGAMASAGAILAQQGHFNAGIEMLQRALKIDPNNAMARQDLLAAMNERAKMRR
ncbi:MAG: tetratricopeptide repeat protein [Tepidisphaeraceae bacterium]